MKKGDILAPRIEEPDILIKEVKIQHTGRQFTLPIPIQVVEALDIEKGDIIVFEVPLEEKDKNKYKIRLKKR